jgi:hypothetical protein
MLTQASAARSCFGDEKTWYSFPSYAWHSPFRNLAPL